MAGFEIYELYQVLSGIKILPNADSRLSLDKTDHDKQMQNNIQARTLLLAFLRMSSKRKMDLLTNMFQQVRNIRILADVLNTFFSVNTKLISYSKISTDSNTLYEQFVQDNDRMLDTAALEESIMCNIEWFKTLEDTDQMTLITTSSERKILRSRILIKTNFPAMFSNPSRVRPQSRKTPKSGLLRLSGGNITKKMYSRLMKIFNKRNSEGNGNYKEYTSRSDLIFPINSNETLIKVADFQPRYSYQDEETDYNPDCPTSKKVMDSRKQWQACMAKVRKEIEADVQKLNEPIIQRMKERRTSKEFDSMKSRGSKVRKNDVTKKQVNNKGQDNDIDWVQFLPLWSVKKIFSYLDEKTLYNLKNVNNYWATMSKEVLAEKKAREFLNATLKKSEEFLDNLMNISLTRIETDFREGEIVREPSGYKKRMEEQRRTGTLLRRKETPRNKMQNTSVLTECFKEFDTVHAPFLAKLQSYPIEAPTVISPRPDREKELSGIVSLSEVTTLRMLKNKQATEQKSPSSSEKEDRMSSTSSTMSLVPSIVVSLDNMETW